MGQKFKKTPDFLKISQKKLKLSQNPPVWTKWQKNFQKKTKLC